MEALAPEFGEPRAKIYPVLCVMLFISKKLPSVILYLKLHNSSLVLLTLVTNAVYSDPTFRWPARYTFPLLFTIMS